MVIRIILLKNHYEKYILKLHSINIPKKHFEDSTALELFDIVNYDSLFSFYVTCIWWLLLKCRKLLEVPLWETPSDNFWLWKLFYRKSYTKYLKKKNSNFLNIPEKRRGYSHFPNFPYLHIPQLNSLIFLMWFVVV